MKNIKIQLNSKETQWITTAAPEKGRLILMSKREYQKILDQIDDHPNQHNQAYRAALVKNAQEVTLDGFYSPSQKLARMFKLDTEDIIIIREKGFEYFEFWAKSVFLNHCPSSNPENWSDQSELILNLDTILVGA